MWLAAAAAAAWAAAAHAVPQGATGASTASVRRLRGRHFSTLQVQSQNCTHGIQVLGSRLGQLNGVYVRDDVKEVNGRETYWLPSGAKFMYYCPPEGAWKINWGQWYGDPDKVGAENCFYVGFVDAPYPTAPGVADQAWYGWTTADGVAVQPSAHAACVPACDVDDGSGPSSVYPCTCGAAACTASQTCGGGSCAECAEILLSGIDAAAPAGWADTVDGRYLRDNCKTIDGRETYWHTDGDHYMYYCGGHRSWGISAESYTHWASQGGEQCLVKVDGVDNVDYPTGTTQWYGFHEEQWHPLEGDWFSGVTCPATAHKPVTCAPTAVPTSQPTLVPARTTPPSATPTTAPVLAGQCRAPHQVADVSYSAGPVHARTITSPSTAWLPSEGAVLHWPDGGVDWLRCGIMYRLGGGRRLPAGSSVSVACTAPVCDAYVFSYHEPPFSGATNGGLPSSLPVDGWVPGSCAPSFSFTSDEQCRYPMVAHRRQLSQQQTVSVLIDAAADAMYTVVVVVSGSDCDYNPRHSSQAKCEAADEHAVTTCQYNAAEQACEDVWCGRRFGGGTGGGGANSTDAPSKPRQGPAPSREPTAPPTVAPSVPPTGPPTAPSGSPTAAPVVQAAPTQVPSAAPSALPSPPIPSLPPTNAPSRRCTPPDLTDPDRHPPTPRPADDTEIDV
eukprot:TRINITY_DN7745_c0_g1_i1.p1 TRINITY_DN7745_c0_g1~~TRINITY_DN7745_c0_g1_i1.p1  ORF type:complete len:688 (+),score=145.87 TRINITY_DN7745_c0_g1_i1:50-2065(+)